MEPDVKMALSALETRLQELERFTRNVRGEVVVDGKTSATANATAKYTHRLGRVPTKISLIGNAYVYDVTEKEIDIRSTGVSQVFKITLS